MAKSEQDTSTMDLRDFFSASEARIDRWPTLNRIARRSPERAQRLRRGFMSSALGLAGLGSATVDILAGLADPFALLPLPALRTSGASDFGIWDLHTSTGVRSITRSVALAPAHRGYLGYGGRVQLCTCSGTHIDPSATFSQACRSSTREPFEKREPMRSPETGDGHGTPSAAPAR